MKKEIEVSDNYRMLKIKKIHNMQFEFKSGNSHQTYQCFLTKRSCVEGISK